MVILLSSIRANLFTTLKDLYQSLTLLVGVILYIIYAGLIGYFLFRNDFEGYQQFPNFGDGVFNLVILLTTANFPDVMLPAYNKNWFYASFFIIFLILGLFFLLNLVLAKVFVNYKKTLESRSESKGEQRVKHIQHYFEVIDKEGKGYLTIEEAKKFFSVVFELNYTRRKD